MATHEPPRRYPCVCVCLHMCICMDIHGYLRNYKYRESGPLGYTAKLLSEAITTKGGGPGEYKIKCTSFTSKDLDIFFSIKLMNSHITYII